MTKYTNLTACLAIPKVIELSFASCNNSNNHTRLRLEQFFSYLHCALPRAISFGITFYAVTLTYNIY